MHRCVAASLLLLAAPAWAKGAPDFPSQYVGAVRAAYRAAHLPQPKGETDTPEAFAEQLRATVAEGSRRMIPDRAVACLAAVKGLTTKVLWSAEETARPAIARALEACRSVDEGAHADGERCGIGVVCQSGHCDLTPRPEAAKPEPSRRFEHAYLGICAPRPVAPPCQGEGRGDCRAGLQCRDGVCGPPGRLLGEECSFGAWNRDDPRTYPNCAQGICFEGRCLAVLPVGAPCVSFSPCGDANYCQFSEEGGHCAPRKAEGAVCDAFLGGGSGGGGSGSHYWLTGDRPLLALQQLLPDHPANFTLPVIDRECTGTQVCAGRTHGEDPSPRDVAGRCAVPRGMGAGCTPGPKPREGLHVRTGCLPDLACDRTTRRCVKGR